MAVVSLAAQIIDKVISILSFAILIRAVISFFPDLRSNKYTQILYDVTEPLLKPFRRIQIGGSSMSVDFSPLFAILVLWLIQSFCVRPFF